MLQRIPSLPCATGKGVTRFSAVVGGDQGERLEGGER